MRGRRELPRPALVAIQRSLSDVGKSLSSMQPSRVPLAGGRSTFQASPAPTFYNRFRTYLRTAALPPSGVHVLRHSAAKLRRDVGESVESVSQFLDHSSLAVTTTYLRRLEGQRDAAWQDVATRARLALDGSPPSGGLHPHRSRICSGGVAAHSPSKSFWPAAPPHGRIGV